MRLGSCHLLPRIAVNRLHLADFVAKVAAQIL
jgi:hypothetical protein